MRASQYCTAEQLAQEMELIPFTYLAHKKAASKGYYVPPQRRSVVLIDNGQVFSNLCPHQQAIMLEGAGILENPKCPVHGWPCSFKGTPIPMHYWNDMVFSEDPNLPPFSWHMDMPLRKMLATHLDVNWKTYMGICADLEHIRHAHPGLSGYIDCDNTVATHMTGMTVQTARFNPKYKPGSKAFEQWHRIVNPLDHLLAVMWMVIYPNVLVEIFPYVTVIGQVVPTGPQSCINIEEYYTSTRGVTFDAFLEAFSEFAQEDVELYKRLQDGRQSAWISGDNPVIQVSGTEKHWMEWIEWKLQAATLIRH